VGQLLNRLGVVPASPENAEAALARGAVVLVYPGGDIEDCRPWRERHHVDLAGHTGFVRLALRTGVPVVPVVAHGSHEVDFILSRGDGLARLLRLPRLRVHVFPLVAAFPFGLMPIWLPHLPLPARVTVEVLDPLDWNGRGGGADDPSVIEACYREVVERLQHALDRLAAVPALPLLDPPPRPQPVGAATDAGGGP
jgi:1-acyl-sn-glycerol-3-phosphate acyltransferase